MRQQELLFQLETELRATLSDIRNLYNTLDRDALRHRPNPEVWNILECMAHINRYADDYIPGINRAIHRAKARCWMPAETVQYTARGRRLLRRAQPDNGKTFKARKRYNFSHQPIEPEVIKSLIIKCEQLLRILDSAKEVDINRPTVDKVGSWFGRYTLGNLLEFLVLHNRRHLHQATILLDNVHLEKV
jgi:hypothetical protein